MDRDTQKHLVYDAEKLVAKQLDAAARGVTTARVAGSTLTVPLDIRFGSLDAVNAYLESVQRTDWFAAAFPRAAAHPADARQRRGNRKAHYEWGTIAVHEPDNEVGWAMRGLVVNHELAHHTRTLDGPAGGAAHDEHFVAHMLRITRETLGPEAELLLMVTYANSGVAMTPLVNA